MVTRVKRSVKKTSRATSRGINGRGDYDIFGENNDAPSTSPLVPDVSKAFTSIVQIASQVLQNPDIAYRTDRRLSEQMIRDPMVMGPLTKRMLATAQLEWQILPDDDKDPFQKFVAETVDSIVRKIPRKVDMFRDLLWGIFRGTGVSEIYWEYYHQDQEWGIERHRPHNGDKITYDIHGSPRLLTRDTQPGGRELTLEERERLLIFTFDPDDGSFYEPQEAGYVFQGRGLRDLMWQYWWLKHNALKFWVTFLERFGGGFIIGKYPMANNKARLAIESVLKNMISDSKITLPVPAGAEEKDTYGIEPITVGGTAENSRMFKEFVDEWAGKHIRLLIEGQEQAQQSGGDGLGSGRAEALQGIFRMYRDYDATVLGETITQQLVQRIQYYNFGTQSFTCHFEFILEEDDYEQAERRVKIAKEAGIAVPKTWAYEALGIPIPQDDDELLEFGQQEGMGMGMPGMPGMGGMGMGGGLGDMGGNMLPGGDETAGLLTGPGMEDQQAAIGAFAKAIRERYEVRRAPKGGVTLKGKFYPGGEFIPGHVLDSLTGPESEALQATENAAKPFPQQGPSFSEEMEEKAAKGNPSMLPIEGADTWETDTEKARVPHFPNVGGDPKLIALRTANKLALGKPISPEVWSSFTEGQRVQLLKLSAKELHLALKEASPEAREHVLKLWHGGQRGWIALAKNAEKLLKQEQKKASGKTPRIPKGKFKTHAAWSKWVNQSEDHLAALVDWVGGDADSGGHYDIRRCFAEQGNDCTDPGAKALEELVEKAPQFKGTVWRGLSFETEEELSEFTEKVIKNKTFSWKAPSSATKSPDVASQFAAGSGLMAPGIVIKMKVKKGADLTKLKGEAIDNATADSPLEGEEEVILSRKSKFRLVDLSDDGMQMELEEV